MDSRVTLGVWSILSLGFFPSSFKKIELWCNLATPQILVLLFPVRVRIAQPLGEVAEWSIAAVLKTVELRGSGGSNPSLSAKNRKTRQRKQPGFFIKRVPKLA